MGSGCVVFRNYQQCEPPYLDFVLKEARDVNPLLPPLLQYAILERGSEIGLVCFVSDFDFAFVPFPVAPLITLNLSSGILISVPLLGTCHSERSEESVQFVWRIRRHNILTRPAD
jgi:hypothetical protein